MAMYDQEEVPTLRRGIVRALSFVVIAVVLWFLVWLLFFRDTSPKTSNTNKTNNTNKSQSTSDKQKTPSTNTSNNSGNKQPDELADTGAGNVIALFAATSAAGTVVYHVYQRRKLASQEAS